MKTETFKGQVAEAYGKVLPSPVKFEGSFEAFESYDELKTANAVPSNEDITDYVNAKRKAAARAKATTDALTAAGHAKPSADDPEVIRANQIKQNMKLYGVDEATATKILEAAAAFAQSIK